jgi:hypothetical protein
MSRRFQFSLRTLLVVVILAAVVVWLLLPILSSPRGGSPRRKPISVEKN